MSPSVSVEYICDELCATFILFWLYKEVIESNARTQAREQRTSPSEFLFKGYIGAKLIVSTDTQN